MAVVGSPFPHGRGGGAVGVFDQFSCRPCVAEAGIDCDVGIDTKETAKREEFIGADIVRLHGVPDGIEDGRALVDVADAVTPLIRRDKVPAGESQNAKAQLFECGNHFRAESVDVVSGHERNCADLEGACACAGYFKCCVVSVRRGAIAQWEFAISRAESMRD